MNKSSQAHRCSESFESPTVAAVYMTADSPATCDIARGLWRCERWCVIPLLASPQGGEAASSRKCCEATEADAAGVVFLCVLNRKTTPASRSADASRHFI